MQLAQKPRPREASAGIPAIEEAEGDDGTSAIQTGEPDLADSEDPRGVIVPLTGHVRHDGGQGILPTFLADVENEDTGRSVTQRILIDTGAQISLCSAQLQKLLNLKSHRVRIEVGPIGGGDPLLADQAVEVILHSRTEEFQLRVKATVLPELAGVNKSLPFDPLQRYPSARRFQGRLADEWPQKKGVEFHLVLGQDYLWAVYKGAAWWPEEADPLRGPVFVDTPFGVIIQGFEADPRPRGREKWTALATALKVPGAKTIKEQALREPPIEALLKRMWSLEAIGIAVPPETGLSATEQYAVEFLEKHIEFLPKEKKFRVRIPFNPNKPPLLNNKYSAIGRLNTLMQHLERMPQKKELYIQGMKKYMDKKHCCPVTKEDEEAEEVFYLPHSGVLEPLPAGEGIKLRIVFDCSARDRNGNSLNDTMVTGPVPDADLVRILTIWRQGKYAFNMDVKDCFLNILLHKTDQNKFRFLWYPDGICTGQPTTYKFTSLIFGSKCSPWISSTCLWKLLDLHSETQPELVEKAKRGLWVDDILLSTETVQEAQDIIASLEKMFAMASFSLAKFTATDDTILDGLKDEQLLFERHSSPKGPVKALGVDWDLNTDELFIGRGLEEAFERKKPRDTKRTLARMVATVFDPLQLLLPWKVGGTLLIRRVWSHHQKLAEERGISKTAKCLWDEPVPEDIQKEIDEWKRDYNLAPEVKLTRCLKDEGKVVNQELWGFCDASPLAFGCVVYLRTTYRGRAPSVRFVVARGKVNPPDAQSLPRCELLSAKFLATLSATIKEYLGKPDAPTYLFGDSMIALHWLKQKPEKWKVFVSNAVTTIQKCTRTEDWYHVAGTDNPADLLTRPRPLKDVIGNAFWLEGPSFVREGVVPSQPDFFLAPTEALTEVRKSAEEALVGAAGIKNPKEHPVPVIFGRISDGLGALRVLARVLQVRDKIKSKTPIAPVDRSHINKAMTEVARYLQQDNFSSTLKQLGKGENLSKEDRLASLNPFIDPDGLLRVQGRSGQRDREGIPYDWLHPIILPSSSDILAAIILYIHEANNHAGTDFIHATMRQKWWILKGRATILRYKKRCITCQRFHGQPMKQRLAPLPTERTAVTDPPFRHVAIDGLGPMRIKIEADSEGPAQHRGGESKVWLLVISCMTTRAINIEILHGQTAEAFIHAMRRHFAEFGMAHTVRLDNLRSHQRMSKEFQILLDKTFLSDIREKSKKYGIKWSWSSVGQPSTNGIIERCVRMVKECLLKTVGRKMLTNNELETFIREARRIINSRPLSQVHHGEAEDFIPVTPNHLIYGRYLEALPFGEDTIDGRRKPVKTLWNERQKMIKEFNSLFQDQYLSKMLELKKWKKEEEPVKVGDLCLITDPSRKRRDWPIGVIDQLMQNRQDGLVRSVKVRVADGTITRSIRSLIFLKHLEDYQGEKGRTEYKDIIDPPRDEQGKFEYPPEQVPEEATTAVPSSQTQIDDVDTAPRQIESTKGERGTTEEVAPEQSARLEESEGRVLRSGRRYPAGPTVPAKKKSS